jgi:hypothetical protein
MHFHGIFLGSQHEIWSKQHNGKVRAFDYRTVRYIIQSRGWQVQQKA